jgi:hypothetical protein
VGSAVAEGGQGGGGKKKRRLKGFKLNIYMYSTAAFISGEERRGRLAQ